MVKDILSIFGFVFAVYLGTYIAGAIFVYYIDKNDEASWEENEMYISTVAWILMGIVTTALYIAMV